MILKIEILFIFSDAEVSRLGAWKEVSSTKKAGELIKKSLSIRKWVRAGLEIKS